MNSAIADVVTFGADFSIGQDSPEILDRLLELLSTHPGRGKQVHDTNIVANMLAYGVARLLTFNTGDSAVSRPRSNS